MASQPLAAALGFLRVSLRLAARIAGTALAAGRLCATLVLMRSWGAACGFIVSLVLSSQPLAAQDTEREIPLRRGDAKTSKVSQPKAAKPSAVLLVMESAGGIRAAGTLRNALNASDELRILSQAELVRQPVSPAAILTVSAVASQVVSVAYWDMSGTRDLLSSPAPARADQMDAVVLALASALLERHRPDLLETGRRSAGAVGSLELTRTTDALYAVLGRFGRSSPRTNVSLRFEDF
jgi:hypothetical protein